MKFKTETSHVKKKKAGSKASRLAESTSKYAIETHDYVNKQKRLTFQLGPPSLAVTAVRQFDDSIVNDIHTISYLLQNDG